MINKYIKKLFLVVLMCCLPNIVLACEKDYEGYKELNIEHGVVVGSYLFDESYGFSPSLRDYAIAARTIPEGTDEYVYDIQIISEIDYFDFLEQFTKTSINDESKMPTLDLTYIYRSNITNAEETNYEILTCATNTISAAFTGSVVTGDNEYATSVTRYISAQSKYNLSNARYCISSSSNCIPNQTVQLSDKSALIELNYPDNKDAQYACIKVYDENRQETETICDSVGFKVDSKAPVITPKSKLTMTEGEVVSTDKLFDITYGVSGGTAIYYYYYNGEKMPLSTMSDLAVGENKVDITTIGTNGLKTTSQTSVTVRLNQVVYDAETNGGTLDTANTSVSELSYNARANLKIKANREGYNFIGWNTDPTATSALSELVVKNDITLYAIYEKTLTATFNIYSENASVPASTEFPTTTCTIYNNQSSCEITIANISSKVGYIADGWSIDKGIVATLNGGEKYNLTADTTFYSVTYAKTANTGSIYYLEGTTIKNKIEKCYKYNGASTCTIKNNQTSDDYNGLELVGYTTDTSSIVNANYTISKGTNFYAYYKSSYNIDFISGESNTKITQTPTVYYIVNQNNVDSLLIKESTPNLTTISGYTPIGYTETEGSIEKNLNINQEYDVTSDKTYYGIYQKELSITYDGDGGSPVPASSKAMAYYSNGYIPAKTKLDSGANIKKSNYILTGWQVDDVTIDAGETIEIASNKTIKASWTIDGYLIKFDYKTNGGISSTKSQIGYVNGVTGVIDLTTIVASKPGYTFLGWAEKQNITSDTELITQYPKNGRLTNNVTLYAQFRKVVKASFIISDDVATMLSSTDTASCTIKNAETSCNISLPNVTVNSGYAYFGYATKENAETAEYQSGDTIALSESTNFYTVSRYNIPVTATYHYYDGTTIKTEQKSCYKYNKSDTCETTYLGVTPNYNSGVFTGFSSSQTEVKEQALQSISVNTDFYAYYTRILDVNFYSGINKSTLETITPRMYYIAGATMNTVKTEIELKQVDAIDLYTIDGWRTDNQSTDSEYKVGDKILIDDDMIFNGVYKRAFTIKYLTDENDAPQDQIQTETYSTVQDINNVSSEFTLAPATSKLGHTFANWYNIKDEKEIYTASQKITIKDNKTLKASWTINNYKISYDATTNGGTEGSTQLEVPFQEKTDLTLNAIKPGYTFLGWNTDPNAQTGLLSYTMPAQNVTLYAIYSKQLIATFKMSDQAAGYVDKEISTCYVYNNQTSCTVATPSITLNPGYFATGWNTIVNSTTAQAGISSATSITGDTTLFSVTRNTQALEGKFYSYDADSINKIKVSTSSCYQYNGASSCTLTIPVSLLDYDGANFIGFSSSQTDIINVTSYNISSNQTYYAYYQKLLGVTYHEGTDDIEGSKTDTVLRSHLVGASSIKDFNPKYTIATPLAITGYTAINWRPNEDPANDATNVAPGTELTLTTSLEYYGIYERNITLSYNGNGGNANASNQTIKQYYNSYGNYENKIVTLAAAGTRTGYTFSKWAQDSTSGTQYNVSSQISINKDTTMYALWTANTYTVTYNANNGSVSPASKTVTYDSTYGTLPTPTRTGYTFNGWFTSASGGTQITTATKVTITANQTIYAQWTANTYTVTFNANSGSTPTPNKTVTYNGTYGTLPTPTRSTYNFTGWYTAATGGTLVTTSSIVTITANQTLYAQWTPAIVTLSSWSGDGLYYSCTNGKCKGVSKYSITPLTDLTGFNTLNISGSLYAQGPNGAYDYLYYCIDKSSTASSCSSWTKIATGNDNTAATTVNSNINISSYTGEYYIKLYFYYYMNSTGNTGSGSFNNQSVTLHP